MEQVVKAGAQQMGEVKWNDELEVVICKVVISNDA